MKYLCDLVPNGTDELWDIDAHIKEWTKELPTEEGWYWVYIQDVEPFIVTWNGKEWTNNDTWKDWDNEVIYNLGPLPIPELPEDL
jgi:hypothetical protein